MSSFAEAKSATLRATGYSGTETLTGFPALVKLSASNDAYGFSYSDCVSGKDDLWFTDADGNLIPHDVDTWNASGDSYVWVRFPSLAKNAEIVMHWGATRTAEQTCTPADTWAGYVGVWHMNETGTTAEPDKTANGLNAAPQMSSGASASLNTAAGAVGAGRAISSDGMYFSVGSSDKKYHSTITTKANFSVSGWWKLSNTPSGNGYQRLICGMSKDSLHSWDVWREDGSKIGVRSGNGSYNTSSTGYGVAISTGDTWHYLTVAWEGNKAKVYKNGSFVAEQTLRDNTHPFNVFTIGGRVGASNRSFVGSFDEVRMYNGVASADRAAADYKTMNTPTMFLTLSSGDMPAVSAILTHRWSFNGTTDAQCLADSVGGSSYAATANGDCVTFKDGKAELHGHGNGTGYVNLGANLLDTEAATLEMWVTKHGTVNWSRVFEYSVNKTYFIIHCWSNGKDEKCTLACWSNGKKFDTTISDFAYDCETPYHVSMTIVANGDGSSTIRIMARDTKTGALVLDRSGTASGWTLANYANPSLKLGYSTSGDKDGFAAYDEVRVYSGVVGDGQLSANAVAGPDALLNRTPGDDSTGFSVSAGSKFVISSTNAVSVSGAATFGAGAKIRFDVSDFFKGSASFTAGSYSISGGGSLADIVELSDSVNYQATVSGNTVTVSPSAAFANVAVAATWKGGATAPNAAALANAANWASTNAYGAAVSAVPSQYTAVTIPAGATAFTIPEGYTPNWRSVKFAPVVSAMRWARKKYSGTRSDIDVAWNDASSWRYMPFPDYDTANGTGANFSSLGWAAADWAISQRRFDGWFYVSPAEAGAWRFYNSYDDYFAFAVDGEWVMSIVTFGAAHRCTRNLKAGWHRFTIVCGDTYGGYSSSLLLKVSVNGGSERNFDALTFGSGPAQTITLADDCDWSALGELSLDADVTIDLNGHNLKIGDMAADFIGAAVTNSSSAVSTIYFVDDPMHTKAHSQGFVKEAGTKIRLMQSGARIARWTGAVDGDVSKPGNWDISFDDGPAPVTLPNSDYTVVVSGDNVNMQVPSGATLACAAVKVQDCTFAADCDWRGLSVTPDIVGTADLAGHNLQLNALAADSGSSFVNGGEGTSEVRLPTYVYANSGNEQSLSEIGLVGNYANIVVGDGVRIVMVNADDSVGATVAELGNVNGASGLVQDGEGTVTLSDAFRVGRTSGGIGYLGVRSGKVVAKGISAQNVAGAHALVELAGGELQTGFLDLGNNSSGSSTINQTGGTFTGTGNIWLGRGNGGTGVYNLTGGTFGTGVVIGQVSGTTGRMTVGGAGVANLPRGCTVGAEGVGYLTITNGGTVTASSFLVGGNHSLKSGNAAGTVTLTGGELNVTNDALIVGQYKTGTLDIGGDGVVNAPVGVKLGNQTVGDGSLLIRENGVLSTSGIGKGFGAASITFDGGTLVATNVTSGSALVSDIETITIASGGGIVDTAGYDVSITDCGFACKQGSSFSKTGDGTLTVGTLPSVDSVVVGNGTLRPQFAASPSSAGVVPGLLHRWSFNGETDEANLADAVGGAVGTKIGEAVTFENGEAVMSGDGNSAGSLNLGTGLLGTGEGATIEIWATRTDVKSNARVFDYGTDENNFFMLAWNTASEGEIDFRVRKNGGGYLGHNGGVPWTTGEKCHVFVTFKTRDDGSGKPRIGWFAYDDATGRCLNADEFDINSADLTLSDLANANFYLGHSQFTGHDDANARYDEVRIWDGVLSQGAMARSVELGPDATAAQLAGVGQISASGDTALAVAPGATFDLSSGVSLSRAVVSGGGKVTGGTLTATGELRAKLGDCLVINGGTFNIDGAKVVFSAEDLATLETSHKTYVLVKAVNGGTIVGSPLQPATDAQLPTGWHVVATSGSVRLFKGGMSIILR